MASPKDGNACDLESPVAPDPALDADDADPGQVEQIKQGQRETKTGKYGTQTVNSETPGGGSSPDDPAQNEPDPTIDAKWSKAEITPDHNSSWPPASPPTDTMPEEAKVDLIVTTTNVPDGTSASITIYNANTQEYVDKFVNCEIKGGKVVDADTGVAPQWKGRTSADWAPWDHPVFYFTALVTYKGLKKTTPTAEAQALRLLYWHCCVSDAIADSPAGGGLTTGAEMAEIAGLIQGVAHHKVLQQSVNQRNVPVALWGSILRNTFAYHHASHGDINDRTTGAQLNDGNNNPPTVAVGNWRSVIILGRTAFGDAEISQTANVPIAPKYLAYLDTCVAGWEPSFANAFIGRGTQNMIAFRCYIPDGDARTMARNFYRKWCNTHKCDPNKIPDIFFDVGAPYYNSMRPVLFGKGAGAIASPFQQTVQAIGNAISSAVSSIANLFN